MRDDRSQAVPRGLLTEAGAQTFQALGSVTVGFVLLLWIGLNAGPWNLTAIPQRGMDWVHMVRASLPLLVFGLVGLRAAGDAAMGLRGEREPVPFALKAWLFYGVLALAFSVRSPRIGDALYWSVAYLGGVLVAGRALETTEPWGRLKQARALNLLTWALTGVFLAALVTLSRDALFLKTQTGLSAYGVVGRVGAVEGVIVSRASGFARFAAIPAVIGFVGVWTSRGVTRWFLGAVTVFGLLLVYLLQSRGATIALVASLGFVFLTLDRRLRVLGLLLILGTVALVVMDVVGQATALRVGEHVARGESLEQLRSFTGRTVVWDRAFEMLLDQPILGWGPQADRVLLGAHVHNTWLYAWMTAGIAGLLALLAGFLAAWRDLLHLLGKRAALPAGERAFVVAAGALLVFFSIRAIPEVSGGIFGVDLLILLPVLAYLGVAARGSREGAFLEDEMDAPYEPDDEGEL